MKSLYSKTVTEEIIRLQANGFSAQETRTYLQDNQQINPALNTIYKHRRSPIGQEMLQELIRHQERSILKADSTEPALAMKYRSDLIGKMMDKLMPNLNYIASEQTINKKEDVTLNINVSADQELLLDDITRMYIKATNTKESASLH